MTDAGGQILSSAIPMKPVASVDDLLDAARKGALASTALDAVKDKLTEMRDRTYYTLLNEPDPAKVISLRSELRGIEVLARKLLIDEANGDVAYRRLLGVAGTPAPSRVDKGTMKPETVSRTRRQRATAVTRSK